MIVVPGTVLLSLGLVFPFIFFKKATISVLIFYFKSFVSMEDQRLKIACNMGLNTDGASDDR
jgi:hypothetical protein